MTLTREEILEAAKAMQGRTIASTLLLAIALAAEEHPEELRAALSTVFDLGDVQTAMEVARNHAKGALELAYEAQALGLEITKQLERIEWQIDGLYATLRELKRQGDRLARQPIHG
jgi:hypothetical protein